MPKITIEGQEFSLAPETLQTISEALEATVAQGKEHGFYLCDTGAEVVPGPKCVGMENCIALKDCEGIGPVIGEFHSHPQVISFSLSDYLLAMEKAYEHPQHRSLLCVGLLDKEVRCKALKGLPPKAALAKLPKFPDTEENREKVKPYWTAKVAIPLDYIAKLLVGTPWEELPPATPTVAVDEGEGPVLVQPPVCVGAELAGGLHNFMASGQGVDAFIQSRMGLPATVNACGE